MSLQSMSRRAYASAEYWSVFLKVSCDLILVCLVSFGSMILTVLGEEGRRKTCKVVTNYKLIHLFILAQ